MISPLDVAALRRALVDSPVPFRLSQHARVGSTQDLAAEAASAGAAEGLVILADQQLSGRGRAGRSWVAPPGSALMFSLLLRPPPGRPDWSTISLAAGLAVVEGVALAGGPRARLKWPNDCLCGERKLAGILAEASPAPAGGSVVLGVGCNVRWEGCELSPELRRSATACDVEGRPVDPTRLAEEVLRRLAARYLEWCSSGFRVLRDEWLRNAAWMGEEVVADHPSGPVRGRAVDISDAGELILASRSGTLLISAGELRRRRRPLLRLARESATATNGG